MSRIGLKPVILPKGVSVSVGDGSFTVKGTKGELTQNFRSDVSFSIKDDRVVVERRDDSKQSRAMHGLYRALLNNMVIGVSQGFSKTLLINGVGYRAEESQKSILFSLGYSTPIEYQLPEGIQAVVEGGNKVVVNGADKQVVGQVAAEIRGLRPPEPYKGKGIRYENENVRRKAGKSGIK